MYKRISNGELIDLEKPLYTKQDGIYGYLILSNKIIYFIYETDGTLNCNDVTQYFNEI